MLERVRPSSLECIHLIIATGSESTGWVWSSRYRCTQRAALWRRSRYTDEKGFYILLIFGTYSPSMVKGLEWHFDLKDRVVWQSHFKV